MKLTRAFVQRRWAVASYFVLIWCLSISAAQATIDVVGGTANPATRDRLAKGNIYQVNTSVILNQFESYLSFSGTETLNFYVFKNSAEFGTYSQVASTSYPVTGSGAAAFYSSGPLNTILSAGQWYILAVSWSGPANTYYYNTVGSPVTSFGAWASAYASGTNPLAGTVNIGNFDGAIYYQRVTTGVPEPSTLLLALSAVALPIRRRRSVPHNRV
jgi:hypothetical protein